MYIYQSRWLKRGELWFRHQPPTEQVDVVDYYQLPKPLPRTVCRRFYTYVISLENDPEQIFKRFNQTTRRDVRLSREKDHLTCQVSALPSAQEVEIFVNAYALFAAAKGRPPLDAGRLQRFLADRSIWLSFAYSSQGELLTVHGMHIGEGRMRSLYAVSPTRWDGQADSNRRQLIGRAGRYLTWSDMMAARDAGLRQYDFGGWYHGTKDLERLSINAYKRNFGGEIVCEYNCQRAFTLKGMLALGPSAVLDYVRRFRAERHQPFATVSEPPLDRALPASLAKTE
jgi:hypothetical protein